MSSPASTTVILASPTDDGGETTQGTPRGANYFFGFLITFVGLLVIFIICGIGSRRRFARRHGLNGTLEPLGRFRKLEGGDTRPQFYEPPLVVGEDRWGSLMPLSVRFCRQKESDPVDHDLPPLPPVTPARRSRSHLSFNYFNRNPPLETHTDPELPDAIQVAVMIAMPWDLSVNQQKNPEGLREYQIGEIDLPWGKDGPHPNP